MVLRSAAASLATLVGVLAVAPPTPSGAASGAAGGTARATTTSVVTTTCRRPVAPTPVATPIPGVPSDWNVTSFDGTPIRVHWFPVHPGAGQ